MPNDDYDDEAAFWRDQRAQSGTKPKQRDYAIEAIHDLANTVTCRHCHAPIGIDCRNHQTGQPLKNLPCHPVRHTDARKAAA
jgi:hypothetical protein